MKTIGIIGGLSPLSTIYYYRTMIDEFYERFNSYAYPEIIIYSVDFQSFIDTKYRSQAQLTTVVDRLARAGADFFVTACNSIHVIYHELASTVPIRWLSIVDAACEAVTRQNLHTVALLGTVFTMRAEFYQRGFQRIGRKIITPTADEQAEVNRIIYDELVADRLSERARRRLLEIAETMIQRGAEGVVLACTELPLAIAQSDLPVPVFDTSALHATYALDYALEDRE